MGRSSRVQDRCCDAGVSSGGIRLAADHPLRAGQKIQVALDWPALLDAGIPLQWIVAGRVLRTEGTLTALRVDHHEFKTRHAHRDAAAC